MTETVLTEVRDGVMIYKPTPLQKQAIASKIGELETYCKNVKKYGYQCGNCKVWGGEHDSGSGFGFNCQKVEQKRMFEKGFDAVYVFIDDTRNLKLPLVSQKEGVGYLLGRINDFM